MKFVEARLLTTASVLEVVSIERIAAPIEPALIWRVTLDTPVDGDAGRIVVDMSDTRLAALGLTT
jgi:hypothetical protein